MSLAILLMDGQRSLGEASGRIYGVVVGVVTDNKDPEGQGRVKVRLPWLSADAESDWARMVSPMAGKERGVFFLPEIDDEVLLAFEHGDPRRPYVLGALWNGSDAPPETNADGKNDKRLIRSRSGLTVLLDDADGGAKITIGDKDGKHTIVVDVAGEKIGVTTDGDVAIKAGGKVTIEGAEITLTSSGPAGVKASGALSLEGQTTTVKGQPINLN